MSEPQVPKPAEKPRLISEADITKYKVCPNYFVQWRLREF